MISRRFPCQITEIMAFEPFDCLSLEEGGTFERLECVPAEKLETFERLETAAPSDRRLSIGRKSTLWRHDETKSTETRPRRMI